MSKNIKCILTDIEGTTTSVSYVYDVLFPYFKQNIFKLLSLTENQEVIDAFSQVKEIVATEEGVSIESNEQVIEKLLDWANSDRKITPLKTLQGIIWKDGYEQGILKGHVYEEVPEVLKEWYQKGITLSVFSSGSVTAQKLIFGYSLYGDLTIYFSNYFDTSTGMKRDIDTYSIIAKQVQLPSEQILFLSDIKQELEAAEAAGMKTIQILRQGTEKGWYQTAKDFKEVSTYLDN